MLLELTMFACSSCAVSLTFADWGLIKQRQMTPTDKWDVTHKEGMVYRKC